MSKSKPIGWITAGTLLCVAGVSIACRLKDDADANKKNASTPPAIPAPPEPAVAGSWSEPAPYQPNGGAEEAEPPTPTAEPKLAPPAVTSVDVVPTPPPSIGLLPPPPPANVGVDTTGTEPPSPTIEFSKSPEPGVADAATPPPAPRVVDSADEPVEVSKAKGSGKTTAYENEPAPRRDAPKVVEEIIPAKPEVVTPPAPPVFDSVPEEPPAPLTELPAAVPVQPTVVYKVQTKGLSLESVAKRTLGDKNRWREIDRLNPGLRGKMIVPVGTELRMPSDAHLEARWKVEVPFGGAEKSEVVGNKDAGVVKGKLPVSHLPLVRAKPVAEKSPTTPTLTGTYACTMSKDGSVVLPAAMLKQFESTDHVLITPGPDRCLWVMSPKCAQCVLKRVEKTAVRDDVVRAFRRLYYAQTEKAYADAKGAVTVPARMIDYAGLGEDLIVIGIEDHFELWDAKRWQDYSMGKSREEKPYGKKRAPVPVDDDG